MTSKSADNITLNPLGLKGYGSISSVKIAIPGAGQLKKLYPRKAKRDQKPDQG